ncbi:MAG: esterase [Methylotenera sp.]|nr:MAG: esterase [Legionella sp.]PPD50887.1 MAG: esterase [Methylotenera sp.]
MNVTCEFKNKGDCSDSSIQIHNQGAKSEYSLGFVEINDQGQFRDERKQLNALIRALESTPKDERLIIVVFVHGWHHSAKEGDDNIESFKHGLASLVGDYKTLAIEREQREKTLGIIKSHKKTKVFGVYVGWRGDSIEIPYLNEVTFWDRKNTAENVGYVALSELLLRLEKVKNDRNIPPSNDQKAGNNRLVVIGHSFGGAAVFQSTAQILASRFMLSSQEMDTNTKSVNKTIKGIGDLVVLINPAFEAIKYAPLFDLAQAQCAYEKEQKPELIILTSTNDSATKTLFPLGRFFSTALEKHGEVKRNDCNMPITYHEAKADNITVGHFEPLQTHELKELKDLKQGNTISDEGILKNAYDNINCNWKFQNNDKPINFGSTEIKSLATTIERNPYLNIKVDPEIIKDHNDILGGKLLDFLKVATYLSTDSECKIN